MLFISHNENSEGLHYRAGGMARQPHQGLRLHLPSLPTLICTLRSHDIPPGLVSEVPGRGKAGKIKPSVAKLHYFLQRRKNSEMLGSIASVQCRVIPGCKGVWEVALFAASLGIREGGGEGPCGM